VSVASRQYYRARSRDRDGVLSVCGPRSRAAAQSPAVVIGVDLVGVGNEPGLYRDHESGLQFEAATRATIVGHMRVAMHSATDPVPAEVEIDRVASVGSHTANRRLNITHALADPCLPDARSEPPLRRVDQLFVASAWRAHDDRHCRVAHPPVDRCGEVE
jgi:hypothetical protein